MQSTFGSAAPSGGVVAQAPSTHWGAGRVVLVVLGSVLALIALAAVAGGGVAIAFDQTQRDSSGYLMTGSSLYSTGTYALVSDSYRAGTSRDLFVARDMLGTVRIRVHSSENVFVGIAPADAGERYLAGVSRAVATRFDADPAAFRTVAGGAPAAAPAAQRFWVATASGTGTHVLSWKPDTGDYRVVVMNADASRGVTADLAIGARFPHLLAIGIGVFVGGVALLALGGVLIWAGIRRRG